MNNNFGKVPPNSKIIGLLCRDCKIKINEGDIVYLCPKCKNIYHYKCWEYNCGCIKFDCRTVGNEININYKNEKKIKNNGIEFAIPIFGIILLVFFNIVVILIMMLISSKNKIATNDSNIKISYDQTSTKENDISSMENQNNNQTSENIIANSENNTDSNNNISSNENQHDNRLNENNKENNEDNTQKINFEDKKYYKFNYYISVHVRDKESHFPIRNARVSIKRREFDPPVPVGFNRVLTYIPEIEKFTDDRGLAEKVLFWPYMELPYSASAEEAELEVSADGYNYFNSTISYGNLLSQNYVENKLPAKIQENIYAEKYEWISDDPNYIGTMNTVNNIYLIVYLLKIPQKILRDNKQSKNESNKDSYDFESNTLDNFEIINGEWNIEYINGNHVLKGETTNNNPAIIKLKNNLLIAYDLWVDVYGESCDDKVIFVAYRDDHNSYDIDLNSDYSNCGLWIRRLTNNLTRFQEHINFKNYQKEWYNIHIAITALSETKIDINNEQLFYKCDNQTNLIAGTICFGVWPPAGRVNYFDNIKIKQ